MIPQYEECTKLVHLLKNCLSFFFSDGGWQEVHRLRPVVHPRVGRPHGDEGETHTELPWEGLQSDLLPSEKPGQIHPPIRHGPVQHANDQSPHQYQVCGLGGQSGVRGESGGVGYLYRQVPVLNNKVDKD